MLIREKMETVKFSPAEKGVVDYLLHYPELLEEKTMQDIASETFTQPSTLIRIAKKLGFSGWVECRRAYQEEYAYLSSHFVDIDANFPFKASDSIMTISKKIASLEQSTIEDTLSLIHHDSLQQAKQLLLKADNIKIFASNANMLITHDFALKMNRIKKHTSVSTVKGESTYEAYNTLPNTCAILISYSGESESVRLLSKILTEQHIPVIGITSIGDNYLSRSVDCFLPITTREKLFSKIGNFTINLSIIYLLDVLYSVVFAENYQKNVDHLIRLGKMVDTRKSNIEIIQEDHSFPTDR
ncbi:MurR/RpiR family transcriptional regulator [Lacticigenium naphthae]|uniref:MurR/RpiR family transcriptional regulator n=1 Tax=Lacticigenium naphthae TaxID=515351 RepID=UPI0004213276|nr:MurR/RpiR family transcriptional regulator [Lacticigenium naphthae]